MWPSAADDSWVVVFEETPIEVNVTEMKVHRNSIKMLVQWKFGYCN